MVFFIIGFFGGGSSCSGSRLGFSQDADAGADGGICLEVVSAFAPEAPRTTTSTHSTTPETEPAPPPPRSLAHAIFGVFGLRRWDGSDPAASPSAETSLPPPAASPFVEPPVHFIAQEVVKGINTRSAFLAPSVLPT